MRQQKNVPIIITDKSVVNTKEFIVCEKYIEIIDSFCFRFQWFKTEKMSILKKKKQKIFKLQEIEWRYSNSKKEIATFHKILSFPLKSNRIHGTVKHSKVALIIWQNQSTKPKWKVQSHLLLFIAKKFSYRNLK